MKDTPEIARANDDTRIRELRGGPVNCREAGPGRGLCIECANGHIERCLYVVPADCNGSTLASMDDAYWGKRIDGATHEEAAPRRHPLYDQGEPYDCQRCTHLGGCPTPANWPKCYTPPARSKSEEPR